MPYANRVATRTVLTVLGILVGASSAAAQPALVQFEKKVRPLFIAKCVSCHGPEQQKGGLRLDSRSALLAGGDRGTAIVPGKPNDSLLLHVLAHDGEVKMPPKNKLSAAEIAAVTEWVQAGAPWPDASVTAAPKPKAASRQFTRDELNFWAFQPARRPAIPTIHGAQVQVRNDIDRFLLAKLQENGLAFSPPADKRTLIRRLSFDLTGLPPTPGEIDAFLKDESAAAYEKLVERLLASTAYGEKWGRHWLDVARYADSNGMDENLAYVNAWRYRDWVIKSFNSDKPYDQFIREQIAGDLMAGGSVAERVERVTATGFLVIGPKMLAEDDPMKMRMDIIDEQLDTLGQAVLGLTLGCARCHDHKFDPIATADYYGLAGIFYSTKTMKTFKVVATWNERALGNPPAVAALADYEKKFAAARTALTKAEKNLKASGEKQAAAKAEVQKLRDQLAALQKSKPAVDEVMAVEEGTAENLKIHLRGNHLTLGDEAPRRFPRIMAGAANASIGGDRSGRLELAEWLTRPEHPLTARVMANRIWAGHFGAGLVRSLDNFGKLGERPTHPELLDWLAAEFVRSNWSIKQMHRLIVNSTAYRMSSEGAPELLEKDPENRLYSHFNRRRLEAEEVRDGMLAIAGLLDRTMGGTLLKANPRQYVNSTGSKRYDGYDSARRSVYLPIIRSGVFDVLQTLDFPDPSVPNGQRNTSTIPTQALLLLNSSLADKASEALAAAILNAGSDEAVRIQEAYRLALGRAPTTAESTKVSAYLKKSAAAADPNAGIEHQPLLVWRGLCRVLLASNEFMFVE
jgi:mono/diheme cytochrome c family protein